MNEAKIIQTFLEFIAVAGSEAISLNTSASASCFAENKK